MRNLAKLEDEDQLQVGGKMEKMNVIKLMEKYNFILPNKKGLVYTPKFIETIQLIKINRNFTGEFHNIRSELIAKHPDVGDQMSISLVLTHIQRQDFELKTDEIEAIAMVINSLTQIQLERSRKTKR
jgi:hypothetical protein